MKWEKTKTGNYKSENGVWIWKNASGRITKASGYKVSKQLYSTDAKRFDKLAEAKAYGETL